MNRSFIPIPRQLALAVLALLLVSGPAMAVSGLQLDKFDKAGLNSGNFVAEARAAIGGTTTSTIAQVVNHGSGNNGQFQPDNPWPGGSGDNFTARWTGYVYIPTGGDWSLQEQSDDDFYVAFGPVGSPVATWSSNGCCNNNQVVRNLPAGVHEFEAIMREGNGGDYAEFSMAYGSNAGSPLPFNTSTYQLPGSAGSPVRFSTNPNFALPAGHLTSEFNEKVAGGAYAVSAITGQQVPATVNWKVELVDQVHTPGLRTQWWDNIGDVGPGGIDAFLAGNTPTSVPEFQSPTVAFGPNHGYPAEVTGLTAGTKRTVRYSGEIFIPEDGTYSFRKGVDQTTRLTIGGSQIILDNKWSQEDARDGDANGGAVFTHVFDVAPGGEWLPFEFVMSESCCGHHATLFWDYDEMLGIGANPDFNTNMTMAVGDGALIPANFFRTTDETVLQTVMGTGEIGGLFSTGTFMNGMGDMIVLPENGGTVRLTVEVDGAQFITTSFLQPAVPEPATLGLAFMALAGLGLRTRRQRAA